jgi:alpha-beta hydrolase superfamily lysophospholipase
VNAPPGAGAAREPGGADQAAALEGTLPVTALPGFSSTQGTLIGARSVQLVYSTWLPSAAPVAVVVLAHGYGEHMGRYRHVVAALVEAGYAVYLLDHRGHGKSEGPRANVERFEYFVADLDLLVERARQEWPSQPLFLLGHSMGGLIAIHYALRHQEKLTGLALSGAALQFGEGTSPVLRGLVPILARLAPNLVVVRSSATGESVLSTDPEVQRQFDADPLCYQGPVLARMGYELLRAAGQARRQMAQLTLPLLIMHGAADPFVNPEGSKQCFAAARSADKTLQIWPGCRHEIFNERNQRAIIAYLIAWLNERLSREEPDRR